MIYELLPKGRENAVSSAQLCQLLGINRQELSKIILKERRDGKPILSSCNEPRGYFAAANRREIELFARSLRHRAGEIFATRRAILKTLDTYGASDISGK